MTIMLFDDSDSYSAVSVRLTRLAWVLRGCCVGAAWVLRAGLCGVLRHGSYAMIVIRDDVYERRYDNHLIIEV